MIYLDETSTKIFSRVFRVVFFMVVAYAFFLGLTGQVWEGDSLAYHIPIAENLLVGRLGHFENWLYYYPASIHVILALFIFLQIPLQLFNVVGIVFLFGALVWLGLAVGLERNFVYVYAVTVGMLTPMIRLIPTQTIDIYLASFFAIALALLFKIKSSGQYFLNLGLILGILFGAKYTGPIFVSILLIIFSKRLLGKISWVKAVIVGMMILLSGGIWYLRNFFETGDFFYPASNPDFPLSQWHTWQTIFYIDGGVWYFFESVISEFLFWPFLLLLFPILFFRKKLRGNEKTLTLLSLLLFTTHMLIPASPDNVLSDMRYTVPTFVCFMLALFLYAQRKKLHVELSLISLISVLSSFTLVMPHRPKFYFLAGLIAITYLYTKTTLSKKVV